MRAANGFYRTSFVERKGEDIVKKMLECTLVEFSALIYLLVVAANNILVAGTRASWPKEVAVPS